jgi:hypothetical protein
VSPIGGVEPRKHLVLGEHVKLGKHAATFDPRDLKFAEFVPGVGSLPKHPARFGHEHVVGKSAWGMLGNDAHGDCVFAGAAHEHMLWERAGGAPVATFTAANVLADYGKVTGFDPATGKNDNGTITREAMSFRRRTGVADGAGTRHKIGAFLSLDPGNWDMLLEAVYLFGAVGIGIEFPDSAMDQFNAGAPWDVVAGASIDGGHYIPLVAKRNRLVCVTWGRTQEMTRRFYSRYCDEAWAIVSTEIVADDGKSPEGLDLPALLSALQDVA